MKSVDASAALAMPGVVDFIDAADLGPAANVTQDIMVHQEGAADPGRQVFAGEKVQFWGQPVGVLLADSRAQAEAAIFAVKVEYADVAAKLVVDTEIPLSWEKGGTPRTMRTGPATRAGQDSTDGECKALSDLQRCFIVKQNITFELQRKHEDNLFYLHDDYFF